MEKRHISILFQFLLCVHMCVKVYVSVSVYMCVYACVWGSEVNVRCHSSVIFYLTF